MFDCRQHSDALWHQFHVKSWIFSCLKEYIAANTRPNPLPILPLRRNQDENVVIVAVRKQMKWRNYMVSVAAFSSTSRLFFSSWNAFSCSFSHLKGKFFWVSLLNGSAFVAKWLKNLPLKLRRPKKLLTSALSFSARASWSAFTGYSIGPMPLSERRCLMNSILFILKIHFALLSVRPLCLSV